MKKMKKMNLWVSWRSRGTGAIAVIAVMVGLLLMPGRFVLAEVDYIPVDIKKFETDYNQYEAQKLERVITHFQHLVEWALLLRQRTILFADILKKRKKSGKAISGDNIETLNYGIKEHLALRKEILRLVHTFEYLVEENAHGHRLVTEELRLKGAMLSLAGALVLYDNFALSIMTFQGDELLRRLANREDKGFDIKSNTLKEIMLSYHSTENRDRIRDTLEWMKKKRTWIKQKKRTDPQLNYLDELIKQSHCHPVT